MRAVQSSLPIRFSSNAVRLVEVDIVLSALREGEHEEAGAIHLPITFDLDGITHAAFAVHKDEADDRLRPARLPGPKPTTIKFKREKSCYK